MVAGKENSNFVDFPIALLAPQERFQHIVPLNAALPGCLAW
jgi:hypothetical protein